MSYDLTYIKNDRGAKEQNQRGLDRNRHCCNFRFENWYFSRDDYIHGSISRVQRTELSSHHHWATLTYLDSIHCMRWPRVEMGPAGYITDIKHYVMSVTHIATWSPWMHASMTFNNYVKSKNAWKARFAHSWHVSISTVFTVFL